MTSGESIRSWRNSLGVSAATLAALAGVNRSLLTLHENGQHALTYDAERAVNRTLGRIQRLVETFAPIRLDMSDAAAVRRWLDGLDSGQFSRFQASEPQTVGQAVA